MRWIPIVLFAAACGSGGSGNSGDAAPPADGRPDAGASDAPRDAAIDASPDASVDAALDAAPDASTTPTPLAVTMTGLGDIALFQNNLLIGRCASSCTIPVDPSLPTTVYASTLGTFVGFDGVPGPANQAGGIETLAAGVLTVAVEFTRLPGERWFADAAGAAFDGSNNLAIVQWGLGTFGLEYASTDHYDPTYALDWSVTNAPGTPAFDSAGDLYTVQNGGGLDAMGQYWTSSAVATSPAGVTLSSGMRTVYESPGLDATVLPGGGVASPSTAGMYADPITLRLYATAFGNLISATTTTPGHTFCLGVDGNVVHLANSTGGGGVPVLAFSLTGAPLGDDGGAWEWCQWGKNWSGGNAFLGYSNSAGWVARTRIASVSNFDSWPPPIDHGVDFGDLLPYNAVGADPAGHLYFQESPPPMPGESFGERSQDPHGLRIRKYIDNSGSPVASIERDAVYAFLQIGPSSGDFFHMGVSVFDMAVAPDGRIAVTVAYVAAGTDVYRPYVIVLPAL